MPERRGHVKILLKVQATGTKTGQSRRGRLKAGAGEEKFLELDVGETVVMVGFPDDEKTRVAVDRSELERALRFILSP
jgi:hypothetical protein